MAYIEFASLFYCLAEEARALNKGQSCPASAKCCWIQLSLDFSDSGWSSTAIKVNPLKPFTNFRFMIKIFHNLLSKNSNDYTKIKYKHYILNIHNFHNKLSISKFPILRLRSINLFLPIIFKIRYKNR